MTDIKGVQMTDYMGSNAKPKIITAAVLESMEFEPVAWAVPDILPEGLTLLAGKPKMGKSWLALGLCLAVASGGVALGTRRVEAGEVLYLALEDNPRRLQRRLQAMGAESYPETLHIATEWNNADEGGVKELDEWLSEHPNCRLVVVDTIKKLRSRKRAGKNAYDVEYEDLEPLLKLTHKHGTSILVVTHFRKDTEVDDPYDAISGSTGLTGAVDGVMLLQRERGSADAFLYVDGRDIEESDKLALRWDVEISNWSIQGDAEKYKMSPERKAIVELLERDGPLGPKAIADKLDKNGSTIKNTLPKMVKDGQIKSSGSGLYSIVDPVDHLWNVA